MMVIKNDCGDVYCCEERRGFLGKDEYSELIMWQECVGKSVTMSFFNAIDGTQPNIWRPYEIKEDKVVTWSDSTKKFKCEYKIIKKDE